ncbi:MAG TPA: hypothetical protein VGK33_10000 [Chloroflexota bacterium]
MPRREYVPDHALRPGRIARIRGIVFQSDGQSTVGRTFIRPLEALDRWLVGVQPRPREPSLAMHAGIHLDLEDGCEYVAEQLVGSFYMDFRNGLNWTPYKHFSGRDRGGWDETVPLTCFRPIDDKVAADTLGRLNGIEGHPFVGEDCTAFIERATGGRRLFADSPLLRWLGIGVRIGDPALPLLKPDAPLAQSARERLQFEKIKSLPEALAAADSPNVRLWLHRLAPLAAPALTLTLARWALTSRRSTRS